jgi:hypothetical protein
VERLELTTTTSALKQFERAVLRSSRLSLTQIIFRSSTDMPSGPGEVPPDMDRMQSSTSRALALLTRELSQWDRRVGGRVSLDLRSLV